MRYGILENSVGLVLSRDVHRDPVYFFHGSSDLDGQGVPFFRACERVPVHGAIPADNYRDYHQFGGAQYGGAVQEMKTSGQIAYEAFVKHSFGIALATGFIAQEWGELSDRVKGVWQAVAEAVKYHG
jgi:hypothetical protein